MTKCCSVCEALQIAINKCDEELQKIREGTTEMPPTFPTNKVDVWLDLQEGRHEYLEGLKSTLDFLLNHENRDKMQV